MREKKAKITGIALFLIALLCLRQGLLKADTFTEDFSSDTSNTTANWDTVNSRVILDNEDKFAETSGVINWGGGILDIGYDSSSDSWLIGGYNGRLNEFDGTGFINHSGDLVNWGTSYVRAVKSNGSYWFIGGDGPKLNKWDGSSWSDETSNLSGFGNVRDIGYAPDHTT